MTQDERLATLGATQSDIDTLDTSPPSDILPEWKAFQSCPAYTTYIYVDTASSFPPGHPEDHFFGAGVVGVGDMTALGWSMSPCMRSCIVFSSWSIRLDMSFTVISSDARQLSYHRNQLRCLPY